jgi:hypothetical protein
MQDSTDDLGNLETWAPEERIAKCLQWAKRYAPPVSFTQAGLAMLEGASILIKKVEPALWVDAIEGADQEAAVELYHFLHGIKVLFVFLLFAINVGCVFTDSS